MRSADLFADHEIAAALNRKGRGRGKRVSRGKRDDSGERGFEFQCRAYRLPPVHPQFVLQHSTGELAEKTGRPRIWRFDFAFVEHKVIVEIDGGVWVGGAHAHPVDITRNMAKRNDAALAGFIVLAFTPKQVKKGEAIAFTQRVLASRGWSGPPAGADPLVDPAFNDEIPF